MLALFASDDPIMDAFSLCISILFPSPMHLPLTSSTWILLRDFCSGRELVHIVQRDTALLLVILRAHVVQVLAVYV